jgi:hypothetical protein
MERLATDVLAGWKSNGERAATRVDFSGRRALQHLLELVEQH